jgi:hypothetical protein
VTKRAKELAVLWMRRGEALDLIGAIKHDPADPRNAEIVRTEAAVAQLEQHIDKQDFVGAHEVIYTLDRLLFKLRASEAAPFVRTGRKQHAALKSRRDAHNIPLHEERLAEWARWNEAAKDWEWEKRPSKNAAARFVKKKLGLSEEVSTIAKRIKKVGKAS